MSTQLPQSKTSALLENSRPAPDRLERTIRALLVTPHLEVRQHLVRTLNALRVDVVACSTVSQAQEVLCANAVDIIFCDDHLADGRYSDLLQTIQPNGATPRVVVTTRTGEWELYFEAVGKGAFDVIRCPWHATDVEMVVLRALREAAAGRKGGSGRLSDVASDRHARVARPPFKNTIWSEAPISRSRPGMSAGYCWPNLTGKPTIGHLVLLLGLERP
jgi:DNA-binding NtrC family response regulator